MSFVFCKLVAFAIQVGFSFFWVALFSYGKGDVFDLMLYLVSNFYKVFRIWGYQVLQLPGEVFSDEGSLLNGFLFFFCTAALRMILKVDILINSKKIIFDWCCMCKWSFELESHLLLHCIIARQSWSLLFSLFR